MKYNRFIRLTASAVLGMILMAVGAHVTNNTFQGILYGGIIIFIMNLIWCFINLFFTDKYFNKFNYKDLLVGVIGIIIASLIILIF